MWKNITILTLYFIILGVESAAEIETTEKANATKESSKIKNSEEERKRFSTAHKDENESESDPNSIADDELDFDSETIKKLLEEADISLSSEDVDTNELNEIEEATIYDVL